MTNAPTQSPSSPAPPPAHQASHSTLQGLPAAWIERLFSRLVGFYGSKFADLWKGTDLAMVKQVWAETLAGYTPEEIKRGIDACLSRPFPPTLPEFLMLCRPPLNYEAAHTEAVEQMRKREFGEDVWTSPAVYWAAARIGNDIRAQAYEQIKGRWHAELDKAIADVKAGRLPGEVPKKAVALPAPGETTPPPEKVKEMLAKMRITLGANHA